MPALAPAEHRRLLQLVALTGSNFDGEALAALRKAQKLCADRKLTLADALQGTASAQIDLARIKSLETGAYERGRRDGLAEARRNGGTVASPQAWARECLAELSDLQANEREFLTKVTAYADWPGWLTPKRKRWLGHLWGRLQAQRSLP